MNLDFARCQVYKLNISTCLTEREQDYYNLYNDGISNKKLRERLGVQYPTPKHLVQEFQISDEEANELLESQLNKSNFRKYLLNEIEKFPLDAVREIRKSAIYNSDEDGNVTDNMRTDNRIVWFEN